MRNWLFDHFCYNT